MSGSATFRTAIFCTAFLLCQSSPIDKSPAINIPVNGDVGHAVDMWNRDSLVNPEELGQLYESDIMLPPGVPGKSIILGAFSRWTNAVVPYVISDKFQTADVEKIKRAMSLIQSKTCIKFKPRTKEISYISVMNNKSGCSSFVGRMGGKQEVNLQAPGCTTLIGTIQHELLHALGFYHEHTRYDRDQYIIVNMANVQQSSKGNFNKDSFFRTSTQNIPYDYNSVLHYGPIAFSQNKKPTIETRTPMNVNMGQRTGLSENDVLRIRAAYKCSAD